MGLFRSSLTLASLLAMAELIQGVFDIRVRRRMDSGPSKSGLQVRRCPRFMQPAFVVRDDGGCTNDPHAWLTLFHQNLTAGILLAQ